jgi:hypothetical protein
MSADHWQPIVTAPRDGSIASGAGLAHRPGVAPGGEACRAVKRAGGGR